MKIHREGYNTLLLVGSILLAANLAIFRFTDIGTAGRIATAAGSLILFTYFLQFFRSPARTIRPDSSTLLAPADGSLVVVEETVEEEYFGDKRLQVSIFMSPTNVHSNRSPVSGTVTYAKYHPGKFLVAWHPKSSVLNERSTIVIRTDDGNEILVRQIAGAVARRIKTYPAVGDRLEQGEEFGFIKFGSRVDIFLPPGSEVEPSLGDRIRAGVTVISTSINKTGDDNE